jgi:cell division GTPase FtsZ
MGASLMGSGMLENVERTEQIVNLLAKGMMEPKIAIVGVGGAGSNTVGRLYGSMGDNVEMVAINTDADSVLATRAHKKVMVGGDVTNWQGTKGFPEVGEYCAECAKEAIRETLSGYHIVMVVAGMGGGSGTGMAPVVARIAKESRAVTFVVAVRPFTVEGKDRNQRAEAGIEALRKIVPGTIVLDNDRLLNQAADKTIDKAFETIDRSIVKIVESMCAQVSKHFKKELTKEVKEWMADHKDREPRPEGKSQEPKPARLPDIETKQFHDIGVEAKLRKDMMEM